MIQGYVTAERQAIVSMKLRGADGAEIVIDGAVDTGFTEYLTLTYDLIEALGLKRRDSVPMTMADGTERLFAEYVGYTWWDDAWRLIPISAGETFTLIGMALLSGHTVCITVVEGGPVEIEEAE
jgi:predicted aspartyl protease